MIDDVSLQSSIREFMTEFLSKYDRLDVVIHNATDFDVAKSTSSLQRGY